MRTTVDHVVVRQAAVDAEIAPFVEVDCRGVGGEYVKVDRFTVILLPGREVRQQIVEQ